MHIYPRASPKFIEIETNLKCLQFYLYNIILRRWPKELYEKFYNGSNLFTTTICVLVSAIIKLARETKLPTGSKLYRGLGGDRTFPPNFFKSNDKGHRGVLEWGFMSTTSEKSIAIQYSGIKEGKPFPTVFEIDCGTVDRGADISMFSQYPGLALLSSLTSMFDLVPIIPVFRGKRMPFPTLFFLGAYWQRILGSSLCWCDRQGACSTECKYQDSELGGACGTEKEHAYDNISLPCERT
jgi:hypothetical protein